MKLCPLCGDLVSSTDAEYCDRCNLAWNNSLLKAFDKHFGPPTVTFPTLTIAEVQPRNGAPGLYTREQSKTLLDHDGQKWFAHPGDVTGHHWTGLN